METAPPSCYNMQGKLRNAGYEYKKKERNMIHEIFTCWGYAFLLTDRSDDVRHFFYLYVLSYLRESLLLLSCFLFPVFSANSVGISVGDVSWQYREFDNVKTQNWNNPTFRFTIPLRLIFREYLLCSMHIHFSIAEFRFYEKKLFQISRSRKVSTNKITLKQS